MNLDNATTTDRHANAPEFDSFASPELRAQVPKAQACLQQLEQDRLTSPSDGPDSLFHLLSTPNLAPWTGTTRLGHFELRRELGRGGCGVVFLAWDSLLRREVALKVPRLETLLNPELRWRFLYEGRAAAGLDHPGIVAVHEAGEAGNICYLVSAYCPGLNLAQWLAQRNSPVAVREAAALVAALAEAVQYIHERKIWHRDIKPSNILLQPLQGPAVDELSFIPRLTDFGIAKLLEAQTQHTQSGAILGTPAYMAPEQATGRLADIGPHTDVYALGVVLYELLTGQPPFRGLSAVEVFRQTTESAPEPLRRCRSDVPRDLETICLKCLEKEPNARYVRAGELAADLRRFLNGETVAARPPNLRERARKWCLRPERVRSAGMCLFSIGLACFLWCAGSAAGVVLGLIQPPRPAETVCYVLVHIGLFYGPMMWTGWKVLGHNRFALWVGTLVAFAFFLRMFAVGLIWGDWLGQPQPLEMGGLFENRSERVTGDLMFTACAGILCFYCVSALFALYANRGGACPVETNFAHTQIQTSPLLDDEKQAKSV